MARRRRGPKGEVQTGSGFGGVLGDGLEPLSLGVEPLSLGVKPLSLGVEPLSLGVESVEGCLIMSENNTQYTILTHILY